MRKLLLALFSLCLCAVSALAEERIRSFDVDIRVDADSSIEVKEIIAVNAEGFEVKRGVLRDIPTAYTTRAGVRTVLGLEVIGVERDGAAERYAVEDLSNGLRLRIGRSDVFLNRGPHVYEITYRVRRALGFFEDFDELYWNVTGNDWTFPIDAASVRIDLPPGANIVQSAAYTGRQGEQGRSYQVAQENGSIYAARTTSVLQPGEGFTVAVAWQKGIVAAPTEADKFNWWLRDNAGLLALLAGIAAVLGYYVYAWTRVGRDPPEGTIVPLFHPPEGLGPAASRFIWRQSFDDRAFAAGLVGLAVKKRLVIGDDDGDFWIERKADQGPPLTQSEAALLQALPALRTELKQENHRRIGSARAALRDWLVREYEGSIFVRNFAWFAIGALLSCMVLIGSALLLPGETGMLGLFATGWTAVWWGVILTVGWGAIKGLFGGRGLVRRLASIFPLLFMIPFMGAGVVAPAAILFSEGLKPQLMAVIVGGIVLGLANLAFYYLLRAPTPMGRQLLDKLEGFRMFLATAEEERLKVLHPPEKTPELFERYLPYAMALDCENEWNAKFASVLAAAAVAGAAAPAWYHGSHWSDASSGGFAGSLGSALSQSVASASTAPGSSSGSGGGGSSGGGGGGGGGSGW
jgi:uncharacterized membrane protein YgcG